MSLPLVKQTATFNIGGDTDTSHIQTPANPMLLERENLLLEDDDSSLSSEKDLSVTDAPISQSKDTIP